MDFVFSRLSDAVYTCKTPTTRSGWGNEILAHILLRITIITRSNMWYTQNRHFRILSNNLIMLISTAIQEYISYLKAAKSLGTARTYATGLGHFSRYLTENECIPESNTVEQISLPITIGFISWLYDHLLGVAGGQPEKISERTKNTYFSAVSGFLEYLIIEMQLLPMTVSEHNSLRKAFSRAAKPHNRADLPPDKLPAKEIIAELLDAVYVPIKLPEKATPKEKRRRTLARLRNIAIIETLLSSGMRVGELARLERGHLLYSAQGASVKYAKGKKEREVLFSARAWAAIMDYFSERNDAEKPQQLSSLPVFARHDKRASSKILPLSTRSIQNIFAELASQTGIAERFHLTPHTLRHFFATEFLSQSGDLALTQYALGHSSPTTTRIYAQTKREDYRVAHRHVFNTEGTSDKR